jgi:hypothetical protein
MTPEFPHWTLAVCYRAQWLAIALLDGERVLEVGTHQLPSLAGGRPRLKTLLDRYLVDYAPGEVVLEDRPSFRSLRKQVTKPIKFTSLRRAKDTLLQGIQGATHEEVFDQLIRERPALRRLVTILPATNRIALTEHWRTVQLLAIALGLGAVQRASSSVAGSKALSNH